jgi:hypothetical protein
MKPRQRPDSRKWDFNRDKWNLWPWKHWMTIGIGALCSEGKEKPDHIVLCCDALGSYGDVTSTDSLHKLFTRKDAGVWAVAAHDIGKAAELMTKIADAVKRDSDGTYGKTYDAICVAVDAHKSARFRYEVVPRYGLSPTKGWMEEAKKLDMLDSLLDEEWPNFSIECQLIIGMFAEDGSSRLFHVKDNGYVDPVTMPGFHAIGVGNWNAIFWLTYRAQHLGMGLRRSAYHCYEAKIMAEKSPHVGKDDIEMLIVSPDRDRVILTPDHPEQAGCPVSLTEMKELFKKYGPQSTDDLELSA